MAISSVFFFFPPCCGFVASPCVVLSKVWDVLNCSVFLASWCRKWTQCWRYVWEVHHMCVYMEDQRWTVCVCIQYICVCVNVRLWGHACVCLWAHVAEHERLRCGCVCVEAARRERVLARELALRPGAASGGPAVCNAPVLSCCWCWRSEDPSPCPTPRRSLSAPWIVAQPGPRPLWHTGSWRWPGRSWQPSDGYVEVWSQTSWRCYCCWLTSSHRPCLVTVLGTLERACPLPYFPFQEREPGCYSENSLSVQWVFWSILVHCLS